MSHNVSYYWFGRTQYIPRFGGVLQELWILLGGIICDSFYLSFCDIFVIGKPPPDIFYFSPSVSHRQ